MKPGESTAPTPLLNLTLRMDALKVALLLVLALGLFVDSTFGAVINQANEINSDFESQARAKRSPRKNAPKKPTVKQPPVPQQDFRSDCMTPALELIQSCCPVPLLITKEAQRRCNDGDKRLKMGLFHTIRESYIQPLKNGKTRIPNAKDFKMAAQHFVGGPMCFIECAMKDLRWVGDDGRIDVNAIENQVVGNLKKRSYNAPWVPVATNAIKTCMQEVENLPLQQIQNAKGKQCNTQPGTYINCVRKKLILECPSGQFSESYGCKQARIQLEKCSPVEVLKAINSGQPLPDTNMNGQDGMGNNGMGGNGMDGNMNPGGMESQPPQMPEGEQPQQGEQPPPEMPPPVESPPPEMPQEQPPPPEEAPPAEPAAEAPAEPAADDPQPAAEEPPAEEPPAEEAQPAAEEMAEPPPEEPPAEEPPAEEPPAEE